MFCEICWFKQYSIAIAILLGGCSQMLAVSRSDDPIATAKQYMSNQTALFVENTGQVRNDKGKKAGIAKYLLSANNSTVYFLPDRIAFVSTIPTKKGEGAKVQRHDLVFDKVNPSAQIVADKQAVPIYSYNDGNDVKVSRMYEHLAYKNIYPNVDLEIKSNAGGLKYDFVLRPGAVPQSIAYHFEGVDDVKLKDGKLHISNEVVRMVEDIPESYTTKNYTSQQRTKDVYVTYKLDKGQVSYSVPKYDKSQTLVIDPTIAWSSYVSNWAPIQNFNDEIARNLFLITKEGYQQ
jgi:hypothetical protein